MAEGQQTEQQFAIHRIYIKDSSFEAPNTPESFKQEWAPELHLDINTQSKNVDGDVFEVVLRLTATVEVDKKPAFVAEVKQAGIFELKNFVGEEQKHTLGSFCPSVLYPYAREAVTDMVSRASFPQLILAPINFEALYQQQLQQEQGGEGGQAGDAQAASS
jgi:preprotein translocase subunit SecB